MVIHDHVNVQYAIQTVRKCSPVLDQSAQVKIAIVGSLGAFCAHGHSIAFLSHSNLIYLIADAE